MLLDFTNRLFTWLSRSTGMAIALPLAASGTERHTSMGSITYFHYEVLFLFRHVNYSSSNFLINFLTSKCNIKCWTYLMLDLLNTNWMANRPITKNCRWSEAQTIVNNKLLSCDGKFYVSDENWGKNNEGNKGRYKQVGVLKPRYSSPNINALPTYECLWMFVLFALFDLCRIIMPIGAVVMCFVHELKKQQ